MGRVRPIRGERLGQDRVLRLRGDELVDVRGMGPRLLRGDEPRAHPDRRSARRERRRHGPPGADPAGRDDRHLDRREDLARSPHAVDEEVRAEGAGRRPPQAIEDLRHVLRRRSPDPAIHAESSGVRDRARKGRRGDLANPRLLQRHRAPEQFREFRLEHHDPLRTRMASSPLAMSIAPSQTRFPCRGRPRGEPRPPRSRSAPIVWLTRESTFANLWASYMYNYPYNIMP